jgi:sec-independent protein translocase protein TatB
LFDIAFTELVIIAIVALLVVGPEKLPKVARTLGSLLGRMQRYVAVVKQDVERELQLEELKKVQQDVQQNARNIQSEVTNTIHASVDDIRQVAEEAADAGSQQVEAISSTDRPRDEQA